MRYFMRFNAELYLKIETSESKMNIDDLSCAICLGKNEIGNSRFSRHLTDFFKNFTKNRLE